MRIVDYSLQFDEEKKKLVVEYNKKLATYMGYKYFSHDQDKKGIYDAGWKIHEKVSNISKMNRTPNDYLCRNHNELAYHYDWNWLNTVVTELYNRHGFIVYHLANTSFVWHKEDFEVLNSNAAGQPKHWNHSTSVKNVHEIIIAVWESVALTVEHIMDNLDPLLPEVKDYRRQLTPGRDMTDEEIARFRDDWINNKLIDPYNK